MKAREHIPKKKDNSELHYDNYQANNDILRIALLLIINID